MIEPRSSVKITMSVSRTSRCPWTCRRDHVAEFGGGALHSTHPGDTGGVVFARQRSDRSGSAVPVEWDEVKGAHPVGRRPQVGGGRGRGLPLGAAINQAADTLDGNGDSLQRVTRELTQVAGRPEFARRHLRAPSEPAGTGRRAIGERRAGVQFAKPALASVSQVLADNKQSGPDPGHAQPGASIRGFLRESNSTLVKR